MTFSQHKYADVAPYFLKSQIKLYLKRQGEVIFHIFYQEIILKSK